MFARIGEVKDCVDFYRPGDCRFEYICTREWGGELSEVPEGAVAYCVYRLTEALGDDGKVVRHHKSLCDGFEEGIIPID